MLPAVIARRLLEATEPSSHLSIPARARARVDRRGVGWTVVWNVGRCVRVTVAGWALTLCRLATCWLVACRLMCSRLLGLPILRRLGFALAMQCYAVVQGLPVTFKVSLHAFKLVAMYTDLLPGVAALVRRHMRLRCMMLGSRW